MNPLFMGLFVLFGTLLVMMTGMPIAFSLGIVSVAALVAFEGPRSLDFIAETFLGASTTSRWCRSRCSS